MPQEINCSFSIKSSHEINTVGFLGKNEFKLIAPLEFKDTFNSRGTVVNIEQQDNDKYRFHIISKTLSTEDEQITFIQKFSEYFSFLIAQSEKNPQSGTPFIKPLFSSFKSTHLPTRENAEYSGINDSINISEELTVTLTRTIDLQEKSGLRAYHTDVAQFYYDGLRAEHEKSKYFHWFLILEHLENTSAYKKINKTKLFSNEEIDQIENLAKKNEQSKEISTTKFTIKNRRKQATEINKLIASHGHQTN